MSEEIHLPAALTVAKFAAARFREIQFMQKAIKTITGSKLAFQKLPKHMRRRAMSHNVKRLPRRVREIHLNQMKKSGLPPKQKRPSRKYRRRPYNLTREYTKRQRKIRWLDTHIWHAKRFHMIEKWGYKIPLRPCDRAFRACYRATSNHCLAQDISYCGCIEISGNYTTIVENFKNITVNYVGALSIGAKCYKNGSRWGKVTFVTYGTKKPIGRVDFVWKNEEENNSVLWLFMHPAYFSEVFELITTQFNLKQDHNLEDTFASDSHEIRVRDLRHEIARFRLTGPLSNAVLQNCVKLTHWDEASKENLPDWIKNYNSDTFILQNNFWNSIKHVSTSQLAPNIVLSLIVRDPRFNLPKKRTKSVYESDNSFIVNSSSDCINKSSKEVCSSPIWDESVRTNLVNSKLTNAKIAEMRSNLLVPGSDLPGCKGDPVPIILLQRSGRNDREHLGYGTGWDIILPATYAQPFWVAMNMWGARPGGLKETASILFEMSQPYYLLPDTSAGELDENQTSREDREKYFRLQPNKRTNYNKHSIATPFNCNWKLLLSNWSENNSNIQDIHVVRDRNILIMLQELLWKTRINTEVHKSISFPSNYLVPVVIKLAGKGLCKKYDIICLPKSVNDIKKAPKEPIADDPNEKLRKKLRKEHKVLLKRLRRRRKLARKNGKVIPIDQDLLSQYTSKMRKLWLPEATNIRHSCSREVIGYVQHGDFSFSNGEGKAVGFVTMPSIEYILKSNYNKTKILVRNRNSRQYRIGVIQIIVDF